MPTVSMPKSERALVVQALADARFFQSLEADPAATLGRPVAPSEQARIREICSLIRRLEAQIQSVTGFQTNLGQKKCAGMSKCAGMKCGAGA